MASGEAVDIVGTAGIDVIPVVTGFHTRLKEKILPGANATGDELGRLIANAMAARIASAIPTAVADGARRAQADAIRQGSRTGGAFADSLRAKLEAAFRSMPKLDIGLSDTGVDAQLARLRAKLEDLRNKRIGIDLSVEDAQAKIDDIDRRLAILGAQSPDVRVRVDTATARAALEEFRAEIEAASRSPLTIPVRTGAFRNELIAQIEAAQASLPVIEVDADTDPARRELDRYRAELDAIPTRLRTDANFNDADAVARIIELRAHLDELSARSRVDIDVRADAARASAELEAIQAEVSALDHERATITVDTSGALSAVKSLALNIAALSAIPIAPILTAGAGGLLASFTAAGAGAGAFGLAALPAIKSVTTAIQAQTQASAQNTRATNAQANAGITAAQRALQLAGAQQSLASAQRQAAQSIITADEQVRQAEQAEAQAVQQAADQRKAALQSVKDAEQQLTDAQRNEKDAQDALTQARKDAAKQLADLNNQLADADLSSRAAALAVQRAKANLDAAKKNPLTSPLDLADAQLSYDQAVQAQKEQLQAQKDLQTSAAAQKKAGVDGNQAVQKAAEQLAKAQEDVANKTRAVADAQANVIKVTKQGAQAIADAEQRETDAVRNAANARASAADSIASAERQVQQASLTSDKAITSTTTAADKYQTALSKLSPEARRLFDAIAGPNGLRKAFTDWSKSLQPDVIPVFVRGVDSIKATLPGLTPLVLGAADGIGKLYDKASAQLKTPFWQGFKADIKTSAEPAIIGLGVAFGNVLKGMTGVIDAFLPHMDGIASTMDRITGRFAAWGARLKGSPDFEKFLDYVKTNGPKVAEFIGNILSAALDVSKALSPVATDVFSVLNPLLNDISWLATNAPEVIQLMYGAYLASKLWAASTVVLDGAMTAFSVVLSIYDGIMLAATTETGLFAAVLATTGIPELIGAVVLVVAALGLAVYETYKHVGWFRDLVKTAWKDIEIASIWLWQNVLHPAFTGIVDALKFLGDAFRIAATVVVTLWVAPIVIAVKYVLAPVFTWLWNKVIWPTFSAIAAGASWLYTHGIKPAADWIGRALKGIGDVTSLLWSQTIKPVFTWIGDKASWLYNIALKPEFDLISKAVGKVADSFGLAKDSIKLAWDKIADIAKKPVKFVVDHVYNEGIRPVWNAVAKITGVGTLDPVKTSKWATGGILPGYTPGRDPHQFYSPTGGRLALSGGESIMRPEWTAAVGRGFVDYFNHLAATQGVSGVQRAMASVMGRAYSGGGIVGWLDNSLTSAAKPGAEILNKIGSADYLANPAKLWNALSGDVSSAVRGLNHTDWERMLAKLPQVIVKGLRDVATQAVTSVLPIGGKNYDLSQHGKGALAAQRLAVAMLPAFGWGANQGAPLISLWNGESGWRWNAQNPGSGAYGIPQALPPYKMASAGADWLTNPATQIKWGMGYIRERYHTPANAYATWLSRSPHWYDEGGYLPPGELLTMNHTGKPEPVFTADQWATLRANLEQKSAAPVYAPHNRFFIGNEEITHMVRTEIDIHDAAVAGGLDAGRRF